MDANPRLERVLGRVKRPSAEYLYSPRRSTSYRNEPELGDYPSVKSRNLGFVIVIKESEEKAIGLAI